ncbi:permease-like cell division protein FtsX [Micromonospora sp. NBC_01813]|uniref:permease-like cell division protein FtsX n=1 Tax=Micromonospora sp. NBC_01813 TaxID=2975988 RepID=UPI002DD79E96|nr:permease-like cell division protein FtsX [Micromonospora sp. NBC_01813]WSA08903.1 permease-like cell division protein FtsX [Micromonospora sp. NBC_01813]
MDDLRTHFARALDGEPPPAAPDDLARAAMTGGTRLRRRRQLGYTGAAAIVVVALVAVGLVAPIRDAPTPVPAQLAIPSSTPPLCEGVPPDAANGVAIFLSEQITGAQRDAIETALRADPRLSTVQYESRQAAYERFLELYRDPPPEVVLAEPDLLERVTPDQLPESFRITLADPAMYPQVGPALRELPGVDEVVIEFCPHRRSAQLEGE